MSILEESRQIAVQASLDAYRAERDGVLTKALEDRRDAAIRSLHALEDPWGSCPCEACSGATW